MVGKIDVDGVAGQPAHGANVTIQNPLLCLQSGLQSGLLSIRGQEENVELKTAVNQDKLNPKLCFDILNGNVRQIALQPARVMDSW